MLVVIDTNVLVKAYLFDDEHAKRVLSLCFQGQVTPVVTDEITLEWTETLTTLYMQQISLIMADHGIGRVLRRMIGFFGSVSRLMTRCERIRTGPCKLYATDRGDDKFIQCAVDADIQVILSYDDHLGSLNEKFKTKNGTSIEVMSPHRFWNKYIK